MSEPISGTAAGVVGWKIIGGLAGMGAIGAGLAAFVVMSMTKPNSEPEWRVALACTFIGSIGGGAALIKYLGIEHWSHDVFGLIGQGALMFACGLPAWGLVRALFKYLEKRKDADLLEMAREARKTAKEAL